MKGKEAGRSRDKPGVLSVITSKWAFSTVFAAVFFNVHCRLSESFVNLTELKIPVLEKLPNLIEAYPGGWSAFIIAYYVITAAGFWLCGFMLHRAFFESFLKNRGGGGALMPGDVNIPDIPWDENKLQIIVGIKHNKYDAELTERPEYAVVPEAGMFQNFLITGTIGTGKTASVMYPFLKQVMFYNANDVTRKAGMLVLDVKGNFYAQVLKYAGECGRSKDVVLIELDGEYTYNPLHKPGMEPVDLAERSRTVLELFSGDGKKEAFWDNKASQMMTECIRLLRLIDGYVTLSDIHRIVTDREYLDEALTRLYERSDEISAFEFSACKNYFMGEFNSKAENTIETVKACVTEMTSFFVSSEKINRSFCPPLEKLNFFGFEEAVNLGKIVVLGINGAKHAKVAKTIAAYLKLDFQSEILLRTIPGSVVNKTRPMVFMSDEYQTYATANDGEFYGLSRESRCCSIVSSQSYTSILKTLGNERAFSMLHQNLVNKIWLRSDDETTIKIAQFLTGKEEKRRVSRNISESQSDTGKSRMLGKLVSGKSSLSESVNITTQRDNVFEERIFTQTLRMFTAVCFLAGDGGMTEPHIVHLLPYFKEAVSEGIKSTQGTPVFSFPQN